MDGTSQSDDDMKNEFASSLGEDWNRIVKKVQDGFKLHGQSPGDYAVSVLKNLANYGIDFITMVSATDQIAEEMAGVLSDEEFEQLNEAIKEARQKYNDYLTNHPDELQSLQLRTSSAAPVGAAARLHDRDVNQNEVARKKRNEARATEAGNLEKAAIALEDKYDAEAKKRSAYDRDKITKMLE